MFKFSPRQYTDRKSRNKLQRLSPNMGLPRRKHAQHMFGLFIKSAMTNYQRIHKPICKILNMTKLTNLNSKLKKEKCHGILTFAIVTGVFPDPPPWSRKPQGGPPVIWAFILVP